MIHELKTWPGPFEATRTGQKTYEIRRADRRYAVGDVLLLREWIPPSDPEGEGRYTGNLTLWVVPHLTEGGAWGLPTDLVVMSLRALAFLSIQKGSDLDRLLRKIAEETSKPDLLLKLEPEPEVGACPCIICTSLAAVTADKPDAPGMPQGRFRFN